MTKLRVQLGEDGYRLVTSGADGDEEGNIVDYGDTATLDLPGEHYVCTVEDPDTIPADVEVHRRIVGQRGLELVEDVQVEEVDFELDDDDEDGDEAEDDYEEEATASAETGHGAGLR